MSDTPEDVLADIVSLNPPLNLHDQSKMGTRIIGSRNGLLCLTMEKYIFLWNPSTRTYRRSPVSRILLGVEFVVSGFGYDDVTDDYIVVRMVQFYGRYERASGVFVSGALHWVVGQNPRFGSTSAKIITAFDLGTEEYRKERQFGNVVFGGRPDGEGPGPLGLGLVKGGCAAGLEGSGCGISTVEV
ncbi:hypothetical protein LguiA_013159 [Lonicera macranthoides]